MSEADILSVLSVRMSEADILSVLSVNILD